MTLIISYRFSEGKRDREKIDGIKVRIIFIKIDSKSKF